MTPAPSLPERPPFVLRARLLTPLDDGGTRWEPDARVEVDARGRIAAVGPWKDGASSSGGGSSGATSPGPPVVDLRPWLLLPGMVDLHAHLPQLPNAGVGAGLDLLTWLERYIFPLERDFDASAAERLAPAAFRAFAAAGTTTVVLYGAVFEESLEAAFRAAEAHGIRSVIGKVMMDRLTYDEALDAADPAEIRALSLRQSADLCARWHGRDEGRLRYAYTPRFAVSCTPELLRDSARLATESGAYWQTHLSEDRGELQEVARLFPAATDYLDVYDRAGGLGPRSILAHAIHLSERELARLVASGARVAHCPASNLFLASGAMPLARYLEAGVVVGLGSDVAAGPELSLFGVMRAGAYTQNGLRVLGDERPVLDPLGWLRLGTLAGAQALGQEDRIGSLEPGKEADLVVVDPSLTEPLPGAGVDTPEELMSRLIFRPHPAMVRGAWVRGRLLPASA
ncbi:MAG TPA: amidohydrolase family protein [Candidatus Limnocylindrales bacterium]|nr:amidohydrolase family protein [Candidatus Limnocylindrales bacterium]